METVETETIKALQMLQTLQMGSKMTFCPKQEGEGRKGRKGRVDRAEEGTDKSIF